MSWALVMRLSIVMIWMTVNVVMPSVSLSQQQMDIGDISYCYEGIAGTEEGRRHARSDLGG